MDSISEKLSMVAEEQIVDGDISFDNEIDNRVSFGESEIGERIVSVERDGYVYWLNSRYDARTQAKKWASSFENVQTYSMIILFGLANGMFLEELHKLYPKNLIVVYEPSSKVVLDWGKCETAKAVTESDYVFFAAGKSGFELLQRYYEIFITYGNRDLIIWRRLPGYESAWKEMCDSWFKLFVTYRNATIVCANTAVFFEKSMQEAVWKNIDDAIEQYNLGDLMYCFKEADMSDRAAVIVAAGPSLDKNVDLLVKAKNKALIIAVDSALRTLEKKGIMPDLTISVDPEKRIDRFDEIPTMRQVPMVFEISGNPTIKDIHIGKRFYAGSNNLYFRNMVANHGHIEGSLRTGGSVANSAFSLGVELGFSTIILIGQDLAYPDMKMHAEATYSDQEENNMLNVDGEYFQVEGNDGKPIYTEGNMDVYRQWFEKQIVIYPNVRVINATEGGAKIHGADYMTFEQAIKETCDGKTDIDFTALIDSIGTMFNEEEQQDCKKDLDNLPNKMEKIKKQSREAILAYEEMDRLMKRGQDNTKQFKKAYSSASKITKWYEQQVERRILEGYNIKEGKENEETAHVVKDTQQDEWDSIVETGIKEYERIIKAADEFLGVYKAIRGAD